MLMEMTATKNTISIALFLINFNQPLVQGRNYRLILILTWWTSLVKVISVQWVGHKKIKHQLILTLIALIKAERSSLKQQINFLDSNRLAPLSQMEVWLILWIYLANLPPGKVRHLKMLILTIFCQPHLNSKSQLHLSKTFSGVSTTNKLLFSSHRHTLNL